MTFINRSCHILILVTAFLAGPLWGQPGKTAELNDFRVPDIALHDRIVDAELTLEAFGQRFVIELVPNDVLWSRLPANRRDHMLDQGHNAFYRGGLAGNQASWARINRIGGVLTGMFSDGEQLYMIDKAQGFSLPAGRAVPPDATIIFRLNDVTADWRFDAGGAEHHHHEHHGSGPAARSVPDKTSVQRGTQFADYMVPVTIVSDTEFQDEHGSDTDAVVVGRMNLIDGFYSGQVGTGILLWHHEILDDNGSLASPELSDFREFMSSGDGSGIPFEGQAHLFTGREIEGAAGWAYIDVTCNTTSGVGVNEDLWNDTISALLVAHELGHNFGAGHDDDPDSCPEDTPEGIMNSMISQNNDEFSQCSLDAMIPNLTGASCLQPNAGILFQDRFQSPN